LFTDFSLSPGTNPAKSIDSALAMLIVGRALLRSMLEIGGFALEQPRFEGGDGNRYHRQHG
jgi:hypothetical protein